MSVVVAVIQAVMARFFADNLGYTGVSSTGAVSGQGGNGSDYGARGGSNSMGLDGDCGQTGPRMEDTLPPQVQVSLPLQVQVQSGSNDVCTHLGQAEREKKAGEKEKGEGERTEDSKHEAHTWVRRRL